MNTEDTENQLIAFIRERFLAGDPQGELELDSPLLQWGVIDSLKVAILLTFIREQLGVTVPFQHLSAKNFGTVRTMAAFVCAQAAEAQEATPEPTPEPLGSYADSVHSTRPS